ncbi:MAG: hypothetical protein ACXVGC_09825 [Mycobacteriaceae bacterium]
MKKVKKSADGAFCPKCQGQQFIGKKTLKGRLAGGLLFAPQRLMCVTCGEVLKPG